jgi:hypothetical protein
VTATDHEAGETTLADIAAKLDRVTEFLAKLEPYLPQLERLATLADNPAARFLTRSHKR